MSDLRAFLIALTVFDLSVRWGGDGKALRGEEWPRRVMGGVSRSLAGGFRDLGADGERRSVRGRGALARKISSDRGHRLRQGAPGLQALKHATESGRPALLEILGPTVDAAAVSSASAYQIFGAEFITGQQLIPCARQYIWTAYIGWPSRRPWPCGRIDRPPPDNMVVRCQFSPLRFPVRDCGGPRCRATKGLQRIGG